jgi:regulatory protein
MSFSDKPREPRTARRARPRLSLKMQAIGFLSRREHSRQELREKLLDSLRKRAREDAAQEAAAEESRQAALAQPSNGIDDAFAPRAPEPSPTPARTQASRAGTRPQSQALDTLTFATGAALPAHLRACLEAGAGSSADHAASQMRPGRALPANPPGDALEDAGRFDHAPGESVVPRDCPDDADLEGTDPESAVDRLLDWLVANKYLSDVRFVESRVNARSRKQGTLRIKLELSRHGLALEPEQAAALRESEFTRARELWQRKFGEVAADPKQRARQARFLAARGFAADVVRRVVGGLDED